MSLNKKDYISPEKSKQLIKWGWLKKTHSAYTVNNKENSPSYKNHEWINFIQEATTKEIEYLCNDIGFIPKITYLEGINFLLQKEEKIKLTISTIYNEVTNAKQYSVSIILDDEVLYEDTRTNYALIHKMIFIKIFRHLSKKRK